jgi:hypothetical protein
MTTLHLLKRGRWVNTAAVLDKLARLRAEAKGRAKLAHKSE